MRFNLFAKKPVATFEGAPAVVLNAEQMLRRSVASCFLWEDEFYEDGVVVADRIAVLVAAARAAPRFEPWLDEALMEAVLEGPVLAGRTIVLVDVSGSMGARLSARSDLTRMDAAAGLASVVPGDLRVFTFSNEVVEVPARRGMAGVDAVIRSQGHGGAELGKAVDHVKRLPHDRPIVVTDEQAAGPVPAPKARLAYMVNVASGRNGVGYGPWTHIDGFSEAVIRFMHQHEALKVEGSGR